MTLLLHIARAEIASGLAGVAADVAFLAFLSALFEAEALRWGQENGVEMVGSGMATRPIWAKDV